jgi:hypothetical protein
VTGVRVKCAEIYTPIVLRFPRMIKKTVYACELFKYLINLETSYSEKVTVRIVSPTFQGIRVVCYTATVLFHRITKGHHDKQTWGM